MPDEQEIKGAARRPLASRSTRWAVWMAASLARSAITPNQISVLSILFAALGGYLMLQTQTPLWIGLLGAAACVQLRLLCNLLDGMVAVEGGKATATGPLYNEFPDRIADSILIICLGYVAGHGWLGWLGALLAALTAYIRATGAAFGQEQDFSGIMSKPRRMALLTAGLIVQIAEAAIIDTGYTLLGTAALIAAGSLVTCVTRTVSIARKLKNP